MSLLARRLEQKSQIQTKDNSSNGSTAFAFTGSRLIAYNDRQDTYIKKGYAFNDLVYSAIKLITDKCQIAPWGIYTVTDETAYKQLQGIIKKGSWLLDDFKKAVDLQKKALIPVTNPGKWGELIQYPNEFETHNDYVANGIAYKLITGNWFTWAMLLEGGGNSGLPQQLNNPPPQFVSIDAQDSFPVIIKGYSISQWPLAKWNPKEILHEKFFNPDWSNNSSHLYGQAPLKAFLRRLHKSNASIDAEGSSFENEGIKAIVHMKANPGEVNDGKAMLEEVSRLKNTMVKEWSGTKNRGRLGISAYDIGVESVGMTNEEMGFIASNLQDLRFVCNVFGGIPSQLLNDPDNKTFNNQKEGEKALTSRCVLPHLCAHKDQFNRKAKKDWGFNEQWVYDFDMSLFSELAADAKDIAEWTSKLIAVIPNEQREQTGLSAYNDPTLNEPWVMQGGIRVPLSEFNMGIVDQSLNNGDPNNAGNI